MILILVLRADVFNAFIAGTCADSGSVMLVVMKLSEVRLILPMSFSSSFETAVVVSVAVDVRREVLDRLGPSLGWTSCVREDDAV